MTLTRNHYIALALAAALLLVFASATFLSERRIHKLEQTIETQKQNAATLETKAAELELTAEQYRAKTAYLEQQLTQLQSRAQKQDEQLQTLDRTTDAARRNVLSTRGTRPDSPRSAAELCQKLAAVGHPCE